MFQNLGLQGYTSGNALFKRFSGLESVTRDWVTSHDDGSYQVFSRKSMRIEIGEICFVPPVATNAAVFG